MRYIHSYSLLLGGALGWTLCPSSFLYLCPLPESGSDSQIQSGPFVLLGILVGGGPSTDIKPVKPMFQPASFPPKPRRRMHTAERAKKGQRRKLLTKHRPCGLSRAAPWSSSHLDHCWHRLGHGIWESVMAASQQLPPPLSYTKWSLDTGEHQS